MQTVTIDQLPRDEMRMFSSLALAEKYAAGSEIYFVATNKTYFVIVKK